MTVFRTELATSLMFRPWAMLRSTPTVARRGAARWVLAASLLHTVGGALERYLRRGPWWFRRDDLQFSHAALPSSRRDDLLFRRDDMLFRYGGWLLQCRRLLLNQVVSAPGTGHFNLCECP